MINDIRYIHEIVKLHFDSTIHTYILIVSGQFTLHPLKYLRGF